MKYSRYKNFMKYLANTLAFIKRYRIAIISVLLGVTATVTALLASNGSFVGSPTCQNEIVYGEEISFSANAFMTKTTTQYYDDELGAWVDGLPQDPGTYQLRAYSTTVFGKTRYSKVKTVTIHAKQITFVAEEKELRYGDMPTIALKADSKMAYSDTVSCENFLFYGLGTETVSVEPDIETIKIVRNVDGTTVDVTGYYDIAVEKVGITLTKRSLSIKVNDAEGVYNGGAFTSNKHTIEEGELAYNDVISLEYAGELTKVGSTEISATLKSITSKEGVDVTEYYDCSIASGTLTVLPMAFDVQIHDISQVYNGNALKFEDYVFNTELPYMHSLAIVKYPELTNVGSIDIAENTKIKIVNPYSEDVTSCFTINFIGGGKVTVSQMELSLKSHSVERVYNGEPLFAHGYDIELGSIASSDTVLPEFYSSVTNVGSTLNIFDVEIFNADGISATDNYKIDYTYGLLEVKKRTVKVKTHDLSWVFDNNVHHDGEVGTPAYDNQDVIDVDGVNYFDLLPSNTFEVSEYTTIKYVTDGARENIIALKVLKGEEDLTENYDLTYSYGTLAVTQRAVKVKTHDLSWTFDNQRHFDSEVGTPAYNNQDVISVDNENYFLVYDGHDLIVDTYATIKYVTDGVKENEITLKVFEGEEDLTDNYLLTYINGTLSIEKRSVKVQTHDLSWVFDNETHYDGEVGTPAYTGEDVIGVDNENYYELCNGNTFAVNTFTTIKYVTDGVKENEITLIVLEGAEELTANYLLSYDYGNLTVEKRSVKVQTHDLSWTFDNVEHYDSEVGTPAYNNQDVIEVDNENYFLVCEGHSLIVDTFTTIKYVTDGVKENVITLKVFEGDNDLTANYDLTYSYGTLAVTQRAVKVKTHDLSWVFDNSAHHDGEDGTPVYDNNDVISVDNENYFLVCEGHSLIVDTYATIKYVSESGKENEITFKVFEGTEDLTANYLLSYSYGNLTVEKRSVKVKTHDLSWVFDNNVHHDGEDGTPDYDNNDVIEVDNENYYELCNGNTFAVNTYTTIKYVTDGVKENIITLKVFEGEEDLTENYLLTYTNGTLSVEKRSVKVQTHDLSWIFDNNAHRDGEDGTPAYTNQDVIEVDNENYFLVCDGHDLIVDTYTTIKYVTDGVKENEITLKVFEADNDLTENYLLSYDYGNLTIEKRSVKVKTHDLSWVFDNQIHYDSEEGTPAYTNQDVIGVDNENYFLVCDGHDLIVDTYTTIKYVTDGVKENVITLLVFEGDNDLTANYDLTYSCGTLSVTQRAVKVKTHDLSWTFDNVEHYDSEVGTPDYDNQDVVLENNLYELCYGHDLAVDTYTTIKYVSESGKQNVITLKVLEGDSDLTPNYLLSYDYGTLSIEKRAVKVKTHHLSWVFDNETHRDGEEGTPAYTNEDVIEVDNENFYKLCDGNTFKVDSASTIKYVSGSGRQNVITLKVFEGDKDLTENYLLSYDYAGKLTVTQRPVKIKTHDLSWVYDNKEHHDGEDGTPLYTFKDAIDVDNVNYYGICDGNALKVDAFTTIKYVTDGVKENVITLLVFDGDEDITENYLLSYSYGNLTIEKRSVKVQTNSIAWTFDNNEHHDGEDGMPNYGNNNLIEVDNENYFYLCEGHAFSLTGYTTIKYVKESGKANVITLAVLEGSFDITENYDIEYVYGDLTINERPIYIETESFTWTYDGSDKSRVYYDLIENFNGHLDLCDGHALKVISYTTVRYATEGVGNDITFGVIDSASQEDLTDNYLITVDAGTLVVNKREITIKTGSKQVVYNGEDISSQEYEDLCSPFGVASTDVFTVIKSTSVNCVTNVKNEFIEYKITNGEDDATDSYIVNFTKGDIVVTPRFIKITANSESRPYNGVILENNGYTVTLLSPDDGYGAVVNGQQLKVEFSSDSWILDLGNKTNDIISVDILSGEDSVLSNYDITIYDGELEITKREVTIKAKNLSKIYDATPLINEHGLYEVVSGSIVYGEQFIATASAEITNFGNLNYLFDTYRIERNGEDITENYDITLTEGTLTILKREVVVVTNSNSWVYDGVEHSDTGVTVKDDPNTLDDSLVSGHVAVYDGADKSTIFDVGAVQNVFKVKILSGDYDVSENYNVTYEYGTLEVTQRHIIIESHGKKRMYDGTPLTHHEKTVKYGVAGESPIVWCDELFVNFTGTITDAGTAQNTFTAYIERKDTHDDVTRNYKIECVYGVLEVTQRPITVDTRSEEFIYDATEHSCGVIASIGGEGMVAGDTPNVILETVTKVIYPGSYENKFEINVTRGEEDITKNYLITYSYGTLLVKPRPITVKTGSETFKYNGNVHSFEVIEEIGGEGLIDGHLALILKETVTRVVDAGVYDNIFEIKITCLGEDITKYYDISYDYGTLTVETISITVTAGSAVREYTGEPLTCSEYKYSFEDGVTRLLDHTVTATTSGSITEVGTAPNVISSVIITNSAGDDVTHNFDIVTRDGTLTVTGRKTIKIKPATVYKVYDGTPAVATEVIPVYPYTLEGEEITAEITGSRTEPGLSYSEIVLSSVKIIKDGEDVTNRYDILTEKGEIVVQIPIKIISSGAKKIYDGTPLTCTDYTIEGELVDGDVINLEFPSSITNAGSIKNEIEYEVEYATHSPYTKYKITCEWGDLVVEQRVINYSTGSAEKVFDGTPLTCNEFIVESATNETGLVSGHEIAYVLPELLFPGEIDNRPTELAVLNGVEEVTGNYRFASTSVGTLKVTPLMAILKTESAEKLYDGTPLTNYNYDIIPVEGYDIPESHEFKVTVLGTITDPGEILNNAEAKVYLGELEITEGYEFINEFGRLRVYEKTDGGGEGGGEGGDEGGGNGEGEGGGNGGEDDGFNLDNDLSGDGEGQTQEAVTFYEVISEYAGALYLRERSYGDYSYTDVKATWSAGPKYTELPFNALNLPYYAINGDLETYEVQISKVYKGADYVLANITDLSGETNLNDCVIIKDDTEYTLVYIPQGTIDYTKYSLVGTPYEQYEIEYRNFVKRNYVDLPEDTRKVMEQIIKEQGFDKSDPQIIQKVAQFVSGHVKYDLKTSFTGDHASYFFLEAETAFCQHYATAATALFRTLGIPARFTVGFMKKVGAGTYTNITNLEGHAWVEVYIDGFGWLPVEVTASGSGGNGGSGEGGEEGGGEEGGSGEGGEEGGGGNGGSGGGNGGSSDKTFFAIKPVDVIEEYYNVTGPVYALQEIEGYGGDTFETLIAKGYTYEVTVEGFVEWQGRLSEAPSTITRFVLYDENGIIVFSTEQDASLNTIEVGLQEGALKITPPWIVIELLPVEGDYDGNPLEYFPDDYEVTLKPSYVKDVEFELSGSITLPGKLDISTIDLSSFVAHGLDDSVLVYGEDYYVKIEGEPLTIHPVQLILTAKSETFGYDGKEHTANTQDDFWISEGELIEGHRIEVKIEGSQTDIGQSKNSITYVAIYDEEGKIVTQYYDISFIDGLLTVK